MSFCECGYPESEHAGPVWPYRGPRAPEIRGCEATGCPVFSGARRGGDRWSVERADRRPVQAQGTLL